MYAPPKNGALSCTVFGSDRSCSVQCQNGFDFVVNPPFLYFCSAGEWKFFGLPGVPYSEDLPWPDCAGNQVDTTVISVKKAAKPSDQGAGFVICWFRNQVLRPATH